MIILVVVLLLLLNGCTYGTYNASGSYPNQHNAAEGCEKEKGK